LAKAHYNIKVTGRVQGVWFRDSTRRKAIELEISGFVRNEPDGSVFIEAEGNPESLNKLIAWCREGPPNARVEEVAAEQSFLKNFEGFEINR